MRPSPKAWAVVDKKQRLIRMDAETRALAIFDTRKAAREISRAHGGETFVVAIRMRRV